jgi:hypothetical protein
VGEVELFFRSTLAIRVLSAHDWVDLLMIAQVMMQGVVARGCSLKPRPFFPVLHALSLHCTLVRFVSDLVFLCVYAEKV